MINQENCFLRQLQKAGLEVAPGQEPGQERRGGEEVQGDFRGL